MKLIKKESFKGGIEDKYRYNFEITETGMYLIEIIAGAQSWWQNVKSLRGFFNDDDLTVKLDDQKFPKQNGKRGLFDGEVAWNGNNLKGLLKTNVFIAKLNKGDHFLEFLTDNKPILKSIKISKLKNEQELTYTPQENNPAEDGNQRQWMTVILIDLPLKRLQISANVKKYSKEKEDDDLRLGINQEVQMNDEPKAHKYWYWCGRAKEGIKEFNRELNLSKGLYYIQFWADKMPKLGEVVISFKSASEQSGDQNINSAKFKAVVLQDLVPLRNEPKQNKKNILDELKKGSEVFIIEKAVAGDRALNSQGIPMDSDRWHKVKVQDITGYVYSGSLEIEGEDSNSVEKFIEEKSLELEEDSNLIKSVARQESKFFPYCVSQVEDDYRKGRGVMQLTDQTREEMRNNKKINYDLADPYDFTKNIEAGIIYFKYIRSLFQESSPDYLEKLLTAWNLGPYSINVNERNEPLNFNKLLDETKEFITKVKEFYRAYKQGNSSKVNQGFTKMFSFMLVNFGLALIIGFSLWFHLNRNLKENSTQKQDDFINSPKGKTFLIQSIQNDNGMEKYFKLRDDFAKSGEIKEIDFHFYYGEPLERLTDITYQEQTIKTNGFPSAFTKDINQDGIKELVVELGVGVHSIQTEIYQFKEDRLEIIPVIPQDGALIGFFNKTGIKFLNYDDDPALEIQVDHYSGPGYSGLHSDIYKYVEGRFMRLEGVI